MNLLRLFRHRDGSTRRPHARRRPNVEALEGRQLLSGIVANQIGPSAMLLDTPIGTNVVSDGHVKYLR